MHFFPSRTICFFIFALWVPVLSMAQSRALGGDALVLDDNHGNTLTLTYGNIPPVLGNSTLIFPPGGGSLLVGTGTIGRLPLWTGAAALGNSAIGDNGLAVSITNGESFFVSGTTGTTPASGAGTRMEWIPAKGAFRAGNVTGTQWDDGNIGLYSFAMGDGTTASAQLSTALGEFTTASGGASTALGDGSLASGGASMATGFATTASGDYTTAIGYHANTNNEAGAFVYGDHSTTTDLLANNPDEFDVRAAGGVNFYTKSDLTSGASFLPGGTMLLSGTTGTTPASGAGTRLEWIPAKGAFRAGSVTGTQWDDATIGAYSFATGYGTTASAQLSTALGEFTTASGGASTALGDGSLASGGASLATGFGTTASGDYTTALGYHANTNNEAGAFVYGDHSTTTDLLANNPDEFDVRAAGGVNFYTKSDLSTGVSFPANGGITVTGGPVVQTSEQIAAGGTLDGKASIYNLTSGASTSTAAPTSTTAQVIYVHNATGNSQTIAGASVADGHSATIVYFPGTGWVVTNVY